MQDCAHQPPPDVVVRGQAIADGKETVAQGRKTDIGYPTSDIGYPLLDIDIGYPISVIR